MNIDFKDIKKQALFCAELMKRLNDDVQTENEDSVYSLGMRNKTQKIMDIIRLRRELNKLKMMLN